MELHIAGSVNGNNAGYGIEAIQRILDAPRQDMAHGSSWTGRPSTRLHRDSGHMLKIKEELQMNLVSSQRYVEQALARERTLQVHPPEKTWFYAISPAMPDQPLIGNICPLLTPLNLYFDRHGAANPSACLNYIIQLWELYFHTITTHNARLDEGLSNFGLDAHDRLYYLDDDLYAWDRFVTCGQMLGVQLRSQPWIGKTQGIELGKALRQAILRYFDDAQYLIVLTEQLRGVFLTDARRQVLEALISGLYQPIGLITTATATAPPVAVPQPAPPPPLPSRYLALLADVHANLPALEAVLNFLQQKNISHGFVLGDVVGYGPHPAACIERLQQTCLTVLKGNHDQGLGSNKINDGYSITAKWALAWSQHHTSAAHRQWLLNLPPVLYGEDWIALHGAPMDPTFFNAYVYVMTYEQNLDNLAQRGIRLCYHGHTHIPGIYARTPDGKDLHVWQAEIDLNEYSHALICPGSVGQPRHGFSGAHFAVLDREQNKLFFYQIQYDIQQIINEMTAAGFPDALIHRLRTGA